MNSQTKIAIGSPLASLGGLLLILVPLMGWTFVIGPWSFAVGLLTGIITGVGVTLSIAGLLEQRSERKAARGGESPDPNAA